MKTGLDFPGGFGIEWGITESAHRVAFALEGKMEGVEITPATIGFAQFNRFNQEVAKFVAGDAQGLSMDDVHVRVESGSYRLVVFLTLTMLHQLEPDLKILHNGQNLHGMNPKRAEVVRTWQSRVKRNPDMHIRIEEGDAQHLSAAPVVITNETDFADQDENLWVAVEKELRGQLFAQGGKNKANMHLALENGGDLIVTTIQGFLNTLSEVKVYDTVRVRIKAEQNLQSGELRDAQLIDIRPGKPVFDEEAFNRAVEIGTRAWADVPDIGQWVAEQRGAA